MTKRIKALQRNKRVLFWTKLLIEIKALNAIVTLFYLQRSLELSQLFYLLAIWSVVTVLFEIPSGYVADVIGRKKTIMFGILLHIVSVSILFIADNFSLFALSVALQSMAYTAFSGTDTALLYDSLREIKDTKSSLRVSGKYFSSNRLAKIFIPALGAFIAKDLFNWQFNILIFIDLLGGTVSLAVASLLTEPNRKVDISEREEGLFKDSFKLFRKDTVARNFAINKSLVFISTLVFWRLYQPILKNAGLTVVFLGVFYATFQLITFVINWNFDKLEKKLSKDQIMVYPIVLGIVALFAFLVFDNKWILALASVPILVIGTVRDPIFFEQINLRIKSFNRATTTSVLNIIKSFFDIPILLLVGWLSKFGTNYGIIIGIVLFVIALVFFSFKKKDYLT